MIKEETIRSIPEPTLRRVPSYCQVLLGLAEQGQEYVSCTQLSEALHIDPTLIRKDIALAGATGRPKVGYLTRDLHRQLENFLGWNNARDAILVGAGSLGSALMGYKAFDQYGVNIVMAFDTDPEKVGRKIHDVPVLPLTRMPNLLERMKVHLGILTVPAEYAQTVGELMVMNGILAIWNFAPLALKVPEGIIVQNEDLFSSLGILSSKLAAVLKNEDDHFKEGER
ncbi:MAG TPA: redox-sensing transcriptional repressor Rex [Candidatus Hydrogenedentes bacterium]|jgi:redox-sensing transcriptional repressor|nr:MAG: Redox-sensing transcriptional repressor Rex [Candidatus Hydrogenedentes bacterium ADurb.Bin170]HNZ47650.1 redox-sensing transcriptional repressor Rex [Candidatus Hydrogenedentota bacterium]HOD96046.1 redox-sensing transcriptional repressor Rex [Candidatus Hydrogenedentota bacterium]HOM48021.1 redox-sensing transcriptional repressor Rex [Candidatus Hydrogenedentota bacterium]HOR51534.1 redox-sensing transcriptional repressor Rex [Candidatus Hydrogenedentota bacterium]